MPFFIRKQRTNSSKSSSKTTANKKKNINETNRRKKVEKFKSSKKLDEEILSDEFDEDDEEEDHLMSHEDNDSNKRKKPEQDDQNVSEDDENETAQEKKIRLAKKYLAQLEQSDMFDQENDDEDDDEGEDLHRSNMISMHLKESVLEKMGKLHRTIADSYSLNTKKQTIFLKNGHRKPITACVVSPDGQFVFTAAKDCNLIKWDSIHGKRLKTIFGDHRQNPETFRLGHCAPIQALALSSDFKFLASGCAKKIIHIWCPKTLENLHTFHGHRGPITGLVFRRSFHQLFSCSEDRMVKVWNLDEMCYVESLFGHHSTITAIDSFVRERCLTSGGSDGTIRLWKIPEESNLIFLAPNAQATVDCVRFIDESHFISASDDGSISLWAIFKKRPLCTVQKAHGEGFWITSLVSMKNTDLFATGSHDGRIIFWKVKPEFKGMEKLFEYPCKGFVNWMEFSQDGSCLVAALSREHRLGRWFEPCRDARNWIHIVPLSTTTKLMQ